MALRKTIWRLGCLAAVLAMSAMVCVGEDKPALKTTKDKIVIPGSTVEFSLVQLPAGKVTLKDKDGKEKEFEIKPIWMGNAEVTWDEFDVFWQKLDLPEKERSPQRLEKTNDMRIKIESPYMAPDRDWGHDGFPAGSMSCR